MLRISSIAFQAYGSSQSGYGQPATQPPTNGYDSAVFNPLQQQQSCELYISLLSTIQREHLLFLGVLLGK